MKIIINQPRASYFVGGAEMISFDHASNFLRLGHEVYFFTISPNSIGLDYSKQYKNFYNKFSKKIKFIEINQNNRIIYIYDIIPGEDRCRWNIESIYYNQKFYEYISEKRKEYDMIFSYYNLDAVFIPRNYINNNTLYLCGIPREQNDFQGSFLSAYDNILAISEEVKESWGKYSRKVIAVVSTGVDCERFSIENKIQSDKIKLLFVGRIIARKNVDMLIQAYEMLKDKYNLELTIVGDGPDLETLKKKSKTVIFAGIVDNPEYYYKTSDIFITPSKYGEGLQGTILEAMSSGLVIVATNTEINKELLSDGRGFLVEPVLESVIDGIIKAIETDRVNVSKANREYVLLKYNWIEKCKEILENVI